MTRSGDFPIEAGLPDAPLLMPKQQLESRRSLLQALRSMFRVQSPITDPA
jgi:hypothetical protein